MQHKHLNASQDTSSWLSGFVQEMVDSNIFRVQIDLGNFFSDHKSKAYVSVNRQWKNVRQFHRHIGEIFDVKKFVLLTSDGVYLPGMYFTLTNNSNWKLF